MPARWQRRQPGVAQVRTHGVGVLWVNTAYAIPACVGVSVGWSVCRVRGSHRRTAVVNWCVGGWAPDRDGGVPRGHSERGRAHAQQWG